MKPDHCPICASTALAAFLHRTGVPVHQNLVVADRGAARAVARGELDMLACEECGFVFNRGFDGDKLAYGEDYDNTQSCSAYFDAYLDDLVRELVEEQGVRNCRIVEVGCGKGQFLRKLVNFPGSGNQGFGFDPSYVGPDSDPDGRLNFRRAFYDASCADVPADVVVCRHVIEHVPTPLDLLRSVHAALAGSPNARVFFETPCVEWILEHRVVWDFFYEHCSLFSGSSLRLAFEKTGFAVNRVAHIFGNQYLWLEARVTGPAGQAGNDQKIRSSKRTASLAATYGLEEQTLRQSWLTRAARLRCAGGVALWGAGAKGATFANLLDPRCELIDCVIDINPNKQGRFIPGTGHPIIAPSSLGERGVRSIVLMNPNYREENRRLLAASGLKIDLIDWSDV